MKKLEFIYREILFQSLEKKNRTLTQLELSKKLKISLSTVNHAIKPLKKMAAIQVKLKNFKVIDPKKILYHWASVRDLEKDIIYKTRVDKPISKIESETPSKTIFGAYSAYKFKFKDTPSDYSEVYLYSDDLKEIKKRFPENKKRANLFILKKDEFMKEKTTNISQTFVDLWNLKEGYSKEFLIALKGKIRGLL